MQNPISVFASLTGNSIPVSLITDEISGLYGADLLQELGELIELYRVYDEGAEFVTEGSNGDYVPAELKYQRASILVDKEARFLFAKKPDIKINVPYEMGNATAREAATSAMTVYQNLIDKVFEDNYFFSKLVKAAKDCFIGRRIAWIANFDEDNQKITIDFSPSMEFLAEYKEGDSNTLSKIIVFYNLNDFTERSEQRIFKKKYWLENGVCHVSETIYDGVGKVVEEPISDKATLFPYIPAGVIINDGLTGDVKGRSDLEELIDYESYYSKLANGDMDSERKSMNAIAYTMDVDPRSTEHLSTAPGAYWDLQSDITKEGRTGTVGRLPSDVGYAGAVDMTLRRILSAMYETVDVPNIDLSTMIGTITSGKALKAIYWGLIVRCDEKMLAWESELRKMVTTIIDGSRLYSSTALPYLEEQVLPTEKYEIHIENQYPLPEDESEEKSMDLAQVGNKTMSVKSYIMKWNNKTADEADEEIIQIVKERQLFENAFFPNSEAGVEPNET